MQKIIVGCDGRPEDLDALALGRGLAQATGAGMILSYVFDQMPVWTATQRDYERHRREDIKRILEPALAAMKDVPSQSFALGSSSAARGLHDLAGAEAADLVVLGSTHRGRLGRVLPGSVAEGLLNGAPCAVAIAPRGYRDHGPDEIRSVGVGFSGSSESVRALTTAASLASSLGASLQAIAVVPRHWLRPDHPDEHPFRARLEDALRAVGRSPDADGRLVAGEPVACLSAAAAELDLMVAGSRGYGPVRHVLLGSVSGPLMRACPSPLIVLPRGAEGADADEVSSP